MASIYPEVGRTAWITARRPPRTGSVDPYKPSGFFTEQERSISGRLVPSGVILLTNKECPWRCLMCDLWQHTLPQTVPLGAIPQQIDYALERMPSLPVQLKLYNSGSFFDPAAIPVEDYREIARRVSFAKHLVVESHPRLIGEKTWRWQNLLSCSLEVAMGLETVHPEILPRLNKKFELAHFAQAAHSLTNRGIGVRAFILVNPPFMSENEAQEWCVKSAEFAFSCGAAVVSLIPTRPGNGALDELRARGKFNPPRIETLEAALHGCLDLQRGRVFADTWNLRAFASCQDCFEKRLERLNAINYTQETQEPVFCASCSIRP